MTGLVPSSWGSPLREFNKCHSAADGKFCSAKSYLGREAARAKRLSITLKRSKWRPDHDPTKITTPGFATISGWGGGRVDMEFPPSRQKFKDTGKYAAPLRHPSRAEDLSVLRHEIGHITDSDYAGRFEGDNRARHILAGRPISSFYAKEIGAWKGAIRDAPHHRVRWSTVRTGLRTYLWAEAQPDVITKGYAKVGAEVDRLADRDVATLKRYGRKLRSRRAAK